MKRTTCINCAQPYVDVDRVARCRPSGLKIECASDEQSYLDSFVRSLATPDPQ